MKTTNYLYSIIGFTLFLILNVDFWAWKWINTQMSWFSKSLCLLSKNFINPIWTQSEISMQPRGRRLFSPSIKCTLEVLTRGAETLNWPETTGGRKEKKWPAFSGCSGGIQKQCFYYLHSPPYISTHIHYIYTHIPVASFPPASALMGDGTGTGLNQRWADSVAWEAGCHPGLP